MNISVFEGFCLFGAFNRAVTLSYSVSVLFSKKCVRASIFFPAKEKC